MVTQRLENNLNLDNPTLEETEEQQRMADEIYYNNLYKDYFKPNTEDPRYRKFLIAAENSGINVENIFGNISTKKEHLIKIMGYNVLRGKKNKPIRVKDGCKDSRIGIVYLNIYNRARRLRGN